MVILHLRHAWHDTDKNYILGPRAVRRKYVCGTRHVAHVCGALDKKGPYLRLYFGWRIFVYVEMYCKKRW